jgi:hypothetical protein
MHAHSVPAYPVCRMHDILTHLLSPASSSLGPQSYVMRSGTQYVVFLQTKVKQSKQVRGRGALHTARVPGRWRSGKGECGVGKVGGGVGGADRRKGGLCTDTRMFRGLGRGVEG